MLAMTLSAPPPGGGGRGGGGGGGFPRGGGGGGFPRGGGGGGFGPQHPGPFHPYGRGQGRGLGPYHPYGRGGWWPAYNYGPEVVVVPPAHDCQFTILMPTGEQIIVTGTCPVALTRPVQATITPL